MCRCSITTHVVLILTQGYLPISDKLPKLTDPEFEIIKIVWDRGQVTIYKERKSGTQVKIIDCFTFLPASHVHKKSSHG